MAAEPTPARNLGPLLLAAEHAMDRAAATLRHGRSHIGTLIRKGDHDFASAVDLEIERVVRAVLSEATPEIPILGEEQGGSLRADPVWVLDPIDGTLNFVGGSPLCAISLALLSGGASRLAIVDAPLLGERYLAVAGAGAYRNATRIAVSGSAGVEPVVGLTDFSVGLESRAPNAVRLGIVDALLDAGARIRIHGSAALDLAWLACGRLSATLMTSNLPWDVLGGILLVREAGGAVFDADGADHTLRSAWTVAATPHHKQLVLDAIAAGPTRAGAPAPPGARGIRR